MSDPSAEVEGVTEDTIELDTTIGFIIEGGDEVESGGREANAGEDFDHVVLRNRRESGREVHQDACTIVVHERGVHGGGVDVEEVLENGSATKKSLLAREDPVGECTFPAKASSAGNKTVVTVDNVEWPCIGCKVGWYAVRGCLVGFLR